MRELKFNLTVDSTALINPNPVEFYSKAYITEDVANNYRTLPGIKSKTKIATTTFTNLLKASDCEFGAGTNPLTAITIEVQPVSAMSEICRFDIEKSFLSLSMAQGSGASYEVQPFMNFYWDVMAKEISAEIETIRWKGNLGSTAAGYTGDNAYKALADGYEKQLLADSTVLDVAGASGGITTANVIDEMGKVFAKLGSDVPALVGNPNLRFYVASNVAAAYMAATAATNTIVNVTGALPLTYLGIPIVVAQGMSSNKMVLTSKDNLIYAFDGVDDDKNLKAVNLEDSVAEPKLRTRANLKLAFKIVNGNEIVYYS